MRTSKISTDRDVVIFEMKMYNSLKSFYSYECRNEKLLNVLKCNFEKIGRSDEEIKIQLRL
jgi:hypothetical protein